jgi:hypothetical protein
MPDDKKHKAGCQSLSKDYALPCDCDEPKEPEHGEQRCGDGRVVVLIQIDGMCQHHASTLHALLTDTAQASMTAYMKLLGGSERRIPIDETKTDGRVN